MEAMTFEVCTLPVPRPVRQPTGLVHMPAWCSRLCVASFSHSAGVHSLTPSTNHPLTGVLTWRDCLEYSPAWDTLIWFAILISMSNGLNESGLITTFANIVGQQLNSFNLGWQVSGLSGN